MSGAGPEAKEQLKELTEQDIEFIEAARRYLEEHPEMLDAVSTEGIFSLLLKEGLKAREAGNYGISAAVVVRDKGLEIIVLGRNTMLSEENPHGHAEMNAVVNARTIIRNPDLLPQFVADGLAVVRLNSAAASPEKLLFTTLEPCPMCTVGSAINSNVNGVVIGAPDIEAGGLVDERFPTARLWRLIAESQGLQIDFCQNHDQEGDHYVNPELMQHLNNLFFQTREKLDEYLAEHGFIDLMELHVAAMAMLGLVPEDEPAPEEAGPNFPTFAD